MYNYSLDNNILVRVTEAMDLGILFDQKVTSSSHIQPADDRVM